MTYNFDPEAWYENERAHLQQQHRSGDLTDEALASALVELEQRYEAMLDRLDGTYELP